MTIGAALQAGTRALADSPTPRLDTELLLAHALGLDRAGLLARTDEGVPTDAWERYRRCLERRAAGRPVAYLTGRKEFYGRPFKVNEAVLVPRPESERLVEVALERLVPGDAVVDVGTGSGCLGLTIAAERPDIAVHLVDLSAVALAVAADNAVALGIPRVRLHRADLWPQLDVDPDRTVVVANLPYVPDQRIDQDRALRHEPRMALAGGADGLEVIGRFLTELDRRGFTPRTLLLEHGEEQAGAVAARAGGRPVQHHPDLSGRPRVTEISGLSVRPAGP